MTERTKNSLTKTEVLNDKKPKKISILYKFPLNNITQYNFLGGIVINEEHSVSKKLTFYSP